eukprot:GFUD01030660.1.p1 GENE.GFUD01030660.1~~GFUD01030660.1.p1  ORF type:complete len:225 (+),score=64.61 GFUD01030660.1:146-820(+)
MKLGSNRKSVGMGADIREYAPDNKRIGFGFSKGDDNFGGQRRKELDDFTKSLGKQMNLVMMRMEETKKIRMKMRHKTRNEVEDKFRKKEMDRKLATERIQKNKEWRGRKRSENGEMESFGSDEGSTATRKCIEWMVRSELKCWACQQDMSPPLKIYQCEEGHSVCQQCRYQEGFKVCLSCEGEIIGRNTMAENIAAIVYSRMIIMSSMSSINTFHSDDYEERVL